MGGKRSRDKTDKSRDDLLMAEVRRDTHDREERYTAYACSW